MKKNIFVFVLALCVSTGFSQVYFAIDNIFLNPENPNTQDSVGIILSGNLTSTGSYIDTAFFEIIDNEIFITIDCNSSGGYQMLIDHEKTINLGLLPSGDYHINLSGEFLGDNVSEPNQYFFSVGEFTGFNIDENRINELIIFPNPSSGIFYIDNSDITNIEVFNNVGMLLISIKQNSIIDIKHLPNGAYHIKFYKSNQVFHKTLIKK